jgi:hypothetical protein
VRVLIASISLSKGRLSSPIVGGCCRNDAHLRSRSAAFFFVPKRLKFVIELGNFDPLEIMV